MEKIETIEAKHKRKVAIFSLSIAFFLVIIKIAVAYLTNSLSVYSEALNNGLDIVTVFITFFAIRISTRPADKDHPYGHAKYENFSAIVELAIIFLLCFYIIYKSIERIIYKDFQLNITWYTFLFLILSIAVNVIRVKYIGKAAKKYNSPALKANFINYTGDIFGSAIVIIGLFFARMGFYIIDPIVSIIISILIIAISSRLAIKTIKNLLDYVPKELTDKVSSILNGIPEIKSVNRLKIHEVGNTKFISLDIFLRSSLQLSQVEKIKEKIRNIINKKIPDSELILETKSSPSNDSISDIVKELLLNLPYVKDVHNIFIYKIKERVDISIHVELKKFVKLKEAENLTKFAENKLKKIVKNLHHTYIHIESVKDEESWDDITKESEKIIAAIKKDIARYVDPQTCHNFSILKRNNQYHVAFHCRIDKNLDVEKAHQITTDMENKIKNGFSNIAEIIVHVEPS